MSAQVPRVVLVIENVPLARDHRLRKEAASLLAAGFRVTVVCPRDAGNDACVPGVRVRDYSPPREGSSKLGFVWEYGYSLLAAFLIVSRVFVTEGFDVLQVSSTPDIYFLLAAPYRLLRRRVVFDFKDLSPETYAVRYGPGGLLYRLLLVMERASLRSTDRVVVVNQALRDIACERGGVPAERITIVGNGPQLHRLRAREPRPELREPFRKLCVWVGMIGPQDHVDLALRAFAELVHSLGRTDCCLVVIGTGDALPSLERLVMELDLQRWVRFTGWMEPDHVFDYLATADLGIEPGVEDFVSPVKAMEFMAAGLPFVAFDVEQTRALAAEAAGYARRGDTVEFAGLVHHLLDDPYTRATMGQAGARRVRDILAWEHQAHRYLSLMQELTPAGARGTVSGGT